MKFTQKALTASLMAAGLLFAAGAAQAGAVIDNPAGTLRMGINQDGSLNFGEGVTTNGGVDTGAILVGGTDPFSGSATGGAAGIAFKFPDAEFHDATSPGCLCEGWGVSVNGTTSGYANVSTDNGANNLTLVSFTSGADNATSTTSLTSLPGIVVKQEYLPATNAPDALFRVIVTITNSTLADVTDVKYVRVMDWDVPSTEFAEYVTITGTGGSALETSGDNGFNTANPLAAYSNFDPACLNQDCTDSGINDHGAYFRFNFGTIAGTDDPSTQEDERVFSFEIFYGAAGTEVEALAAITAEGIGLYSLGQSSTPDGPSLGTPATFIFGFKGEGIAPPPLPEPASLALLGIGLAGLGAMRRRKQA